MESMPDDQVMILDQKLKMAFLTGHVKHYRYGVWVFGSQFLSLA